jgi:catechol 2,3-dioxygenase
MATSDAPLQVGQVVLTVNDLDKVGDFYQRVIGLSLLSGDGESRVLGVDRPLVELRGDKTARHRPREAGLFHTAFLLPDRAALGDWLRMIAARELRLDGASDHLVSEAVYLHDPEGNGIEVYADRPRAGWVWQDGEVAMDTEAMDIPGVLAEGHDGWQAAPEGTVIGHVHLQVGDLAPADEFYAGTLGLTRTAHRYGASFYGSGGYHHHLAGNIWNSRGAGRRKPDSTGLAELVLEAEPALIAHHSGQGLLDPWGTRISLRAKR